MRYTLEDINRMPWQVFESTVVEAIRILYNKYSISLKKTPYTADGGRDAEAHYVLAIGLDHELSAKVTIFLEIKQRNSTNVGKADIGSHLVDAFANKVSKIIFITNRDFTASLAEWLDNFCTPLNIQYSLVPGEQVIKWLNKVETEHSEDFKQKKCLPDQDAVLQCAQEPVIEARLSFSTDPSDFVLSDSICHIRPDRPLYAFIDIIVGHNTSPFTGRLQLQPKNSGDAIVHSHQASTQKTLFAPGDHQRWVFTIWPTKQGPRDASDFIISIENNTAHIRIKSINSYTHPERGLAASKIGSQIKIETELQQQSQAWLERGGSGLCLLTSQGGLGKSHLLAKMRHYWQSRNLPEVVLDGENVKDDTSLVLRTFSALFPFRANPFESGMKDAVKRWLKSLDLTEETSETVAEDLCNPGGINPDQYDLNLRMELFFSLLCQASKHNGLVFVLEDLHKTTPSVLVMLQDAMTRLKTRGRGKVLMFLTTRPYLEGASQDLHLKWISRLQGFAISDKGSHMTIPSPVIAEAVEMLQNTIPSLARSHCLRIVEQVGTSPFNLKEALLYLRQIGVLELSMNTERLFLTDPLKLNRLLEHQGLLQATELRLKAFYDQSPAWLRQILEAGACFGRQFPLGVAIKAAAPDQRQFDILSQMDRCAQWSLAVPAPDDHQKLEFDHDIVRNSVLKIVSPITHRVLAGNILNIIEKETDEALKARLAYQAGFAQETYNYARDSAREQIKLGRPADAWDMNNLALLTLDPAWLKANHVSSAASLGIDAAVVQASACRLQFDDWRQRDQRTLEILLDNLRCLGTVSSGSNDTSKAVLTEAQMLCERLGDTASSAMLLSMQGRMHFEQDDVAGAIKLHREAEEKYSALAESRPRGRASNLVRLSICHRQLGQMSQALSFLGKALALRNVADWELYNKIRSNTGAVYLSSDWTKVRHHWRKQLESAQRHGLQARQAHALASLSFINIFDGRQAEGMEQAEEALRIARRNGLDNTVVRCNLNLAVVMLFRQQPSAALASLWEAEELALRHGIGRRLWRVYANLASTHEALGEMEKSLTRDLQTLESLKPYEWRPNSPFILSRPGLPLINITLRGMEHIAHAELLKQKLQPKTWDWLESQAKLVSSGEVMALGNMRYKYLVELKGKPRFLLTE